MLVVVCWCDVARNAGADGRHCVRRTGLSKAARRDVSVVLLSAALGGGVHFVPVLLAFVLWVAYHAHAAAVS